MANFWPYSFFVFFCIFWAGIGIGHILAIDGQGGASGLYFFHRCARRDGGRAGRRADVARIDEKKASIHSGLDFSTIYGPYIPGTRPVISGSGRFCSGFEPKRLKITSPIRAGGKDDGS